MGVSVLNTRSLPPEEYGDVRYVNNFVSFFAGILLLGYFVSSSRLLAIAKTKEEANKIKGGTIVILAITAVAMTVLMITCGLIHKDILHKAYAYLFFSTSLVCISPLLLNYINTTSQGDNSIGTIALARLLPSTTYLVVGFLVYNCFGATPKLMLWLNNGIAIVILTILIICNHPSFKNLKKSLKIIQDENRKYGLHVYYGSIANISVAYIAGITLGLFSVNNINVAYYTLALTISSPLQMAPSVIGTTYFKHFAYQKYISSKILKTTALISILSFLIFCIVIFPLVRILYSPSYQIVAYFACFLALSAISTGIGDVFNRFLGAHGQGKSLRNGAWFSGIISLLGYTIGIYYFDIFGAISTRILSSAAYSISMIYYYRYFVKRA